ncbi:MAG: LytTR family DNA-binding domain-containing protein [Bacteroidota bacterium]
MKINCIIIEDEKPAMDLMEDNVRKIPFLNLVGSCKNTFEASDIMLKEKVDLIFSDVEMSIVSGLQFIKTLKNPPLIILTTAFEQYALEGYELDVIDYLLKPFSFQRFLNATRKAQQQYMLRHGLKGNEQTDDNIFVYSEYKEIKIALGDIIYIEGLKDYVKIFLTAKEHPLLTRHNLKAMEAMLPKLRFCRVHNSYIVNMHKIDSIQKTKVFLGDKTIPIGSAFAEGFIEVYKSTPE